MCIIFNLTKYEEGDSELRMLVIPMIGKLLGRKRRVSFKKSLWTHFDLGRIRVCSFLCLPLNLYVMLSLSGGPWKTF